MRFLEKIGRFFVSKRFLYSILGLAVLIFLFYQEEDWRGARAWAATKAEWEAKGESFDYTKFIPPPVPDDQNLAALPLFKLEPEKNLYGPHSLGVLALRRAMREDLPSIELPSTGNWMRGELPDKMKIRDGIAIAYAAAFKKAAAPEDVLAQFIAVYQFLTGFLADATKRPFFRINEDYTFSPHAVRPLGPLTQQIKLTKLLTLHAILALDHNQSDLALQDYKTNYKLITGISHDPTVIGGLLAIGRMAISNATLYDGLTEHAWSDSQLIEIEQNLKPINFLADFRFAMRCEVAQSIDDLSFFQHVRRSELNGLFGVSVSEIPLTRMLDVPWPSGWWADNKRETADFIFEELETVDPQVGIVYPSKYRHLKDQAHQAEISWDAYAPWKIWFSLATPPIANVTPKFTEGQAWVDEARIACALERYHLAHGVYPAHLAELAPACIDELPHDIMNGEPYRYRLRDDGTFLLYSVGWNQTDEGGTVAFVKDQPKSIDYENGDWVWPTPK